MSLLSRAVLDPTIRAVLASPSTQKAFPGKLLCLQGVSMAWAPWFSSSLSPPPASKAVPLTPVGLCCSGSSRGRWGARGSRLQHLPPRPSPSQLEPKYGSQGPGSQAWRMPFPYGYIEICQTLFLPLSRWLCSSFSVCLCGPLCQLIFQILNRPCISGGNVHLVMRCYSYMLRDLSS